MSDMTRPQVCGRGGFISASSGSARPLLAPLLRHLPVRHVPLPLLLSRFPCTRSMVALDILILFACDDWHRLTVDIQVGIISFMRYN
jgi:hypothetical protein